MKPIDQIPWSELTQGRIPMSVAQEDIHIWLIPIAEARDYPIDTCNRFGALKEEQEFLGLRIESNFIVLDTLDNEFLMGMDIIDRCRLIINAAKGTVSSPGGEEPFYTKPVSLRRSHKIRCENTVTLQPNSGRFVTGSIPIRDPRDNFEGVMLGNQRLDLETSGIFVTRALTYSDMYIIY